jgi:LmbE family N-acetylglucosaminyl deacetylase
LRISELTDVTTRSQHIFLSPHFDDAVYSCGGTLASLVEQGYHPLVITVCGGVPPSELELSSFAIQLHTLMGAKQDTSAASIVEARRYEDACALEYLEVDFLWFEYLDALYRGSPAYYATPSHLSGSGTIHPADREIASSITEDLLQLSRHYPETTWYAPLAVGRHVDHQLVFTVVAPLIERKAHVYFYEDFPYVSQERSLEARLNELQWPLKPILADISKTLPQRIEAAYSYASQVSLNFGDDTISEEIKAYAASLCATSNAYYERYWRPG